MTPRKTNREKAMDLTDDEWRRISSANCPDREYHDNGYCTTCGRGSM